MFMGQNTSISKNCCKGFYVHINMLCIRGSQLISMAGHQGLKAAQRYMSEGRMNTIVLCVSMYFKVDKGSTKNCWRGWICPTGSLLRTPAYMILEPRIECKQQDYNDHLIVLIMPTTLTYPYSLLATIFW